MKTFIPILDIYENEEDFFNAFKEALKKRNLFVCKIYETIPDDQLVYESDKFKNALIEYHKAENTSINDDNYYEIRSRIRRLKTAIINMWEDLFSGDKFKEKALSGIVFTLKHEQSILVVNFLPHFTIHSGNEEMNIDPYDENYHDYYHSSHYYDSITGWSIKIDEAVHIK